MEETTNSFRNYRYRIYPSKKQRRKLDAQLILCKELHNLLLRSCREEYKINKNLTKKSKLFRIIKETKNTNITFKSIHSQVLQNVGYRLDKAYSNFYRRLKEKKSGKKIEVSFPRFKKKCVSMIYPQYGFRLVSDGRLFISRIGDIPIILHRPFDGKIKTMTVKRMSSGKWFVFFNCLVEFQTINYPNKANKVGIDVGLESFAVLSDGTRIESPRVLVKSEDRLPKYHRRLSRKLRGSANKIKAKIRVAKTYEKITNQRTDFLHKITNDITTKYGFVAAEKLNIKGLIHNHNLARSISDASWNQFAQMLCYKASSAGCQVVFVDPRGTSQTCSECGNTVKKELSNRWHDCQECGLCLHRDHNSAIEILNRATAGLAESNAFGDRVRPLVKKAAVNESGTKRVEIDAGNPHFNVERMS